MLPTTAIPQGGGQPTVTPVVTPVISMNPSSFNPNDVPNFAQVNATLFRSGHPTVTGINALKAQGIKTILSFESGAIGDGDSATEKQAALAAGINYQEVPMSGISPPTVASISLALSIISASMSQPMLVHCAHGSDRTGMVVAAYHIRVDKWPVATAKSDMYKYGHSMFLSWWDGVLDKI